MTTRSERHRHRRRRRRRGTLAVSDGDGDPFGTYRLRQVAVLFWPGVVGFAAVAGYAAWSSIDLNRELQLAWWSSPLDTVGTPVVVAAIGPVVMWWLTLRRRFVVTAEGVEVVGYLTRRPIPWSRIRRFDHLLGLTVQTHDGVYEVGALQSATLTHLRGRRDGLDDLAAQLNALIADRADPAADHEPLSVDTAVGRSAIRRTALLVTVVTVGIGLVRLRYLS